MLRHIPVVQVDQQRRLVDIGAEIEPLQRTAFMVRLKRDRLQRLRVRIALCLPLELAKRSRPNRLQIRVRNPVRLPDHHPPFPGRPVALTIGLHVVGPPQPLQRSDHVIAAMNRFRPEFQPVGQAVERRHGGAVGGRALRIALPFELQEWPFRHIDQHPPVCLGRVERLVGFLEVDLLHAFSSTVGSRATIPSCFDSCCSGPTV